MGGGRRGLGLFVRHLVGGTGDAAQRLQQLKDRLGCGTQCGSCVPQLQRMVQASLAHA